MRTVIWALTVVMASVFSSLAGYATSAGTGVEPGYFEAAEAGGYGVSKGDESGTEGMDPEMQDYYESLNTE